MTENNMDFKYDVAVSFLAKDEPFAQDLHGRLAADLRVFVYSKKQEDVAGTDGAETFRTIFRSDSRLVVVLYRAGWGSTRWTAVEQTAITERGVAEGWRFLLFALLDSSAEPPVWLPETRIRLDLTKYSMVELVGAIKARVQELGGERHIEDAAARARRLQGDLQRRARRTELLESLDAVPAVTAEVDKILSEIGRLTTEIGSSTPSLTLYAGRSDRSVVVTTRRVSVRAVFQSTHRSRLDGARLLVQESNGRLLLPEEEGRAMLMNEATAVAEHIFVPDVNASEEWCWRRSPDDGTLYASAEIAQLAMKSLLDLIDRADKGDLPAARVF